MPTYEYRCSQCDNRYETREGFDAPSRQPCPRCGGTAKRVFSAPPIVFKGSGWYITDSRKNAETATFGASDNGGAAAASESSSAEPAPAAASSDD